jgi:hypothetical protein
MDYQQATVNLAQATATVQALAGAKTIIDQAGGAFAGLQSAANLALQNAQALMGGAAMGIKSQLTLKAEAERLVGIGALIDAIKANPGIGTGPAATIWTNAVAAIPTASPLENPIGVVSAIMVIAGKPVWVDFCAMIVAGDRAALIAAVS